MLCAAPVRAASASSATAASAVRESRIMLCLRTREIENECGGRTNRHPPQAQRSRDGNRRGTVIAGGSYSLFPVRARTAGNRGQGTGNSGRKTTGGGRRSGGSDGSAGRRRSAGQRRRSAPRRGETG